MYRDSGLWFAIYNGPVNVGASPVFGQGSVMHVHEPAAVEDPARQYPVIRRDDDAIRTALNDRPLDTFDAEIGIYRHIQGTGALYDLIVSSRRGPDETGDPEFRCQRFQGAQGGGTHPEQHNGIHVSPYQRRI